MKTNQGMTILEILIASAIITIGLVAVIQAYGVYVKYALSHDKEIQASYLLEGGLEAVSLLRDSGWTANVATIGTATTSLYWNGTNWIVSSTTNEIIDGGLFYRNIKVDPVYRDANGRIASSGTLDNDTKLVTVIVKYRYTSGTTTQTISKYLTNFYQN